MTGEQLLLGLAALGGLSGVAALADVYLRRNRTKAEEAKIAAEVEKINIDGDISISDRALEMYKLARADAKEARQRVSYCEAKVDALMDHTRVLRSVMRRHQLEPPPFQFPPFEAWLETLT